MKCVYEELSEQECKCFCGGDKAMRSLGNSVGSIGASICNFLEYFGQMAQNSPPRLIELSNSVPSINVPS